MLESTIGIISRVIEKKLEITVSECTARRVKIKGLYCSGLGCGRFVLVRVEFENVVSVAVFSGVDLLEEVFVAIEPKVAPHYVSYCSNP
jgi:hypothetical protein